MIKMFEDFDANDPYGEENWNEPELVKPKKFRPMPEMLDYHKMMRYLEQKYSFEQHDVAGRFKDRDIPKPYQNFWHYVLDHCFYGEVHNPSHQCLDVQEKINDDMTPEWAKDIFKLIKKEFGDQFNREGELDVWVSW